MAKRTTEEIIPEATATETPEEVFIDESNNATLAEFIGDDKPLEEETETPEEDEVTPEPETPAAPAVDPEKIKEEASRQALDTVKKALGLDEADEEAKKNKDDELVSPWKKENRNPKDYDEIVDWANTKRDILNQRQIEENTRLAAEREEAIKKQNEQVNKVWDEQIAELVSLGKLPSGKEAQDELFKQMYSFNVGRKQEGKPQVLNIKEFYAFHYKSPSTQPAGSDAPISGGSYSQSDEGGNFDYMKDVRNSSFEDIMRGQ